MPKNKHLAVRLIKGLMVAVLCASALTGCSKKEPKKTEAQIESELIQKSPTAFLNKKIKFRNFKTNGFVDAADYNKDYVTDVDENVPTRMQKISFTVKNTSLRNVSFSFSLRGVKSGKDKYGENADMASSENIPMTQMYDDVGTGKGSLITSSYDSDAKRYYNSAYNSILLRMESSYLNQLTARQTITYLKPGEERTYYATLMVTNLNYNDNTKSDYLFIPQRWKKLKPKFWDSKGITAFDKKSAEKDMICYDSFISKGVTYNNPKSSVPNEATGEDTNARYYTGSITNTTDNYLGSVVVYFKTKFDTTESDSDTGKKKTYHHTILDAIRIMNIRPHETFKYRTQTIEGGYRMMMDVKSVKIVGLTYYVDYSHKKSQSIPMPAN